MKKRMLFLALTVALVVIGIAVGSSYAVRTEEVRAVNVITTGNIEIALHEDCLEPDGTVKPFEGPVAVMPGMSVSKIVTVENTGDFDAWIRVKLSPAFQNIEGDGDPSLILLDIDTENWEYRDGYYYYLRILKPGETTEPVLQSVGFSTAMDNTYSSAEIDLDAIAEATQVKNNGTDVWEAAGWPAEE